MKIWAELGVWVGVVAGAGWAGAQQTVTVTTTADFRRGNNEGLTVAAQNELKRDRVTAGSLGSWSPTTALPVAFTGQPTVAHNGYLFLVGGSPDGYSAESGCFTAALGAGGSVGSWAATTALPSERASHSTVAYNGFIYAIGGTADFSNPLDEVLVAPLNANGSIGAWSATTPLPFGRFYHSSFAYNGFIYVIGGSVDGGLDALTDVLVAPLHADGTVGTWSSTTALPGQRAAHACVAYNGFVYAMGGYGEGFTFLSEVLFAPINSAGTVGGWSVTTAFPTERFFPSAVAHNGLIYAVGGYGNGATTEALAAFPNADGTLGSWSSTTPLPAARFGSACVVNGDFLIVLGGFDENFGVVADVLVAPIEADDADANQIPDRLAGRYSHFFDLQSDSPKRYITINGQLSPGGSVSLQVRVAPGATAVFGSETTIDNVPLGSTIEIPGGGRYVWLRLTLDDTGTSNVDQPTLITDIAVSNIDPPTAGLVFDGAGADIDTQTSKTTLAANWSGFAASPGDSLAYYEWAIGTAPGLTNVQGWVNVGLALNASNSSLNLTPGTKYVSVRATAASGLKSSVASSDGVQIPTAAATPGGGGGDDDSKGRCSQSVGASGNLGSAALGALVLAAGLLGRRRARR